MKKLYGAPVRAREHRPRRQHAARQGADDVRAAREGGARVQEEEAAATSPSPCRRARAATRTTCTRSSPVSAATSSARTRPATSTRRDIGVANKVFLKNAAMIDKWNKEGLINSKVDYDTAKNAFLKGQAAFWITGPWDVDTLKTSGLQFKIIQMPKIEVPLGAVPRRAGLHGHEVRRPTHGVDDARQGLRRELHDDARRRSRSSRRRTAATRRTLSPASGVQRPGPGAVRQGRRRRRADAEHPADGQRLGRPRRRWVKSTKGAGATKARSRSRLRRAASPTRSARSRSIDGAGARARAPASSLASTERVSTTAVQPSRPPQRARSRVEARVARARRSRSSRGRSASRSRSLLLAVLNAIAVWAASILVDRRQVDRASRSSSRRRAASTSVYMSTARAAR